MLRLYSSYVTTINMFSIKLFKSISLKQKWIETNNLTNDTKTYYIKSKTIYYYYYISIILLLQKLLVMW